MSGSAQLNNFSSVRARVEATVVPVMVSVLMGATSLSVLSDVLASDLRLVAGYHSGENGD